MNNKAKILIVDDLPKNLMMLGAYLKAEGFDVDIIDDSEKVIEHLENHNIDLLLLDVMMPKINGFELCTMIKDKDNIKDIPIIFLTALTDSENIIKAFEVGGVDYLKKPFQITELMARVKTQIDNKKYRERLEHLNATKDKFFSILAHDLKNPISSIKSSVDIMSRDYHEFTDIERMSYLESLKDTTENVFDLLQNLLAWSRTQTNRIEFNPEIFDLRLVVENITSLLFQQANLKSITLEHSIDDETEVFADVNMIATVIRNLISNSIKFTPERGKIKIYSQNNEDDSISIYVEDNGVGIDENKIPKLFSIASNYSTLGTNSEKGTGLGLILCKEFIDKNDGTIQVTSQENKGTTFILNLPTKIM